MKKPIKLTEKQEKFAILVGVEGLNHTAAFRAAGYNIENMQEVTIQHEGSRLAAKPHVAAKIQVYKESRQQVTTGNALFNVKALAERYVAIALADPNELIGVKVGACRHCWSAGGAYHWKEREYYDAVVKWEAQGMKGPAPDPAGGLDYRFSAPPNPKCEECEGEGLERVVPCDTTKLSPGAKALYRGVQQTKDGLKIKFADQDKALDQIGRMLGAFDDKLRVELDAKIASYKLTTTDPAEAAAAYNRLLTSAGN